jgi:hypothetical protein
MILNEKVVNCKVVDLAKYYNFLCWQCLHWKVIEERIEKRLASWKGKLLSLGGCLVD